MNEKLQLEIAEKKLLKFEQQGGICPRCKNPLPPGAELAHKIGKGPRNIAHYERQYGWIMGKGIGKKIIHHPLNMDLTCPGPCNTQTSIDAQTAIVRDLVEKILEDINGKT